MEPAMSRSGPDLPTRRIAADTVLLRQGEAGDCAWLIQSGELEVLLDGPDGPIRLGTVGANAIVGEMALLDDGLRSATVRALTTVEAVELSRGTFRALRGRCPPLASYLLESLVAAIRRSYGLPQPERQEGGAGIRSSDSFATVADRRMFRLGHSFFRQGDEGTAAYLIQSGSVGVRRDGADLGVLGPGRIFGELALLANRPRAATVVALEATVCEIIRKDQFAKAIETMPPILRSLTRIYIEQLSGGRLLPRHAEPARTDSP
ncbi:cyclic nucleotide-binding domain-containing protein [Azospirillum brasilense]|uniref:Cyclic nucleotide-binding domain-containing protein n=2 Tax=Azospirillum brasilense TaxID=192 RepID=A0A4D8QPT5_AZOBR|nr:cAMP-binding protein [Azospirillum brasilense]OPH19665.1 cAMP-binding protein [Azospirillum brasilense]QCO10930.1 cyclic nucleotide-binding domain-containing protein [Azospirillum brasilense]QEL92379.1 cyclic nucleotide-binding domain-containing protein [Azospirillum brasilense]QEL98683.1 cyclic nucleotide-binding domain-containing protein [Azospirillum brasilense]